MNVLKIKGRMRECQVTVQKAADVCGISKGAMSNKLNGHSEFTVKEMFAMLGLLRLTADNIKEYFYDTGYRS